MVYHWLSGIADDAGLWKTSDTSVKNMAYVVGNKETECFRLEMCWKKKKRNVLRLETNKQNKRNEKCAWWNNSEYLRELSISLSKKWWHLNIIGVDIARGILLDSASGSQQKSKKRNQSLILNSCQVNKADAGKAREFKKRCCCEGMKQHHSGYLVLQGCAADIG